MAHEGKKSELTNNLKTNETKAPQIDDRAGKIWNDTTKYYITQFTDYSQN